MSALSSSEADTLSTFRLVMFSGPAVPIAMLFVPLITYLPAFYATEVGIGFSWVGIAFMLARIWDGVTDPVIGGLSDGTRSRFGRRRSWMLGGALPLMIATYYLCQPGPGVGVIYLFSWLTIFYVAWTTLQVPYMSWGAELSTSYHGRGRIFGFRETGTIVGILLGTGLPVWLLPADAAIRDVLNIITIAAVIMLFVTVITAVLCVGEREAPKHTPVDWMGLYTALKINKPYTWFLVFWLLTITFFNFYNATIILLLTHHLQFSNSFMLYVFIQYVGAIVFIPFCIHFAKKYGRHRVLAIGLLSSIVGSLALAMMPPNSFYLVAIVAFVFFGLSGAAAWSLPPAMVGDLADYGSLKGQVGYTGTYMAGFNLTMKLGTAIGIGIAFPLLQILGFDPQNGASVLNTTPLVIVSCYLPSVLMLLCIAMIWNFPIDARRHAIIQKKLFRRNTYLRERNNVEELQRDRT